EIEALNSGLAGGVRAEPHPYLKVGRRVRVKYGPLAGAQGILVRRKDKFRVVLSIDLIMRSVAVEVDEADVEPCLILSPTFTSPPRLPSQCFPIGSLTIKRFRLLPAA